VPALVRKTLGLWPLRWPAGAPLAAFVEGGTHVLGIHLRRQQLLDRPLHDLAQEPGVVEQDPLREPLGQPTMVSGHPLLL
jgi:hypothetical protein